MTRLGDVTQRNAANSREGSSVGEALFVQVKELGRLVEDLTRIVGVEEGLSRRHPVRRAHSGAEYSATRAGDEVHVERPDKVIPLTEEELKEFQQGGI